MATETSEYDFEVVHRPGRQHGNADALSRMPRPCLADSCRYCLRQEEKESSPDEIPCVCVTIPSNGGDGDGIAELPAMREQQLADNDIEPIIGWMESNHRPEKAEIASCSEDTKVYWSQWHSLQLRDGTLYRCWESPKGDIIRWQLVLPKAARDDVLRQLNDSPTGGHYGEKKH